MSLGRRLCASWEFYQDDGPGLRRFALQCGQSWTAVTSAPCLVRSLHGDDADRSRLPRCTCLAAIGRASVFKTSTLIRWTRELLATCGGEVSRRSSRSIPTHAHFEGSSGSTPITSHVAQFSPEVVSHASGPSWIPSVCQPVPFPLRHCPFLVLRHSRAWHPMTQFCLRTLSVTPPPVAAATAKSRVVLHSAPSLQQGLGGWGSFNVMKSQCDRHLGRDPGRPHRARLARKGGVGQCV